MTRREPKLNVAIPEFPFKIKKQQLLVTFKLPRKQQELQQESKEDIGKKVEAGRVKLSLAEAKLRPKKEAKSAPSSTPIQRTVEIAMHSSKEEEEQIEIEDDEEARKSEKKMKEKELQKR